MTTENVETKLNRESNPVTVEYDFGANLAEAVSKFGEEVVFNNFRARARGMLQSYVKTRLKNDVKPAKMQEEIKDWKPGLRKPRKSQKEKLLEQLATLPPELREQVFAEANKG